MVFWKCELGGSHDFTCMDVCGGFQSDGECMFVHNSNKFTYSVGDKISFNCTLSNIRVCVFPGKNVGEILSPKVLKTSLRPNAKSKLERKDLWANIRNFIELFGALTVGSDQFDISGFYFKYNYN